MFAVARSFAGRKATTLLLALPFAAMACGGDKGTVRTAEAANVAPPAPVMTVTEADKIEPPTVVSMPVDAHGWYTLGLSSRKEGSFEAAKEAFDKSIELDPTFAKAWFNGARTLLDLNRAPEALELIEKGRAIDSISPDGGRLKARAQSESGDITGATVTYKDLLIRDSSDAWTLNNFGVMLMDHNCFQDALGPLARAVQLRPTAPLFLNNLGMALERTGFPITALGLYEEAVRNDSTFKKAVRNVERLKPTITDTTVVEPVSVPEIAERFRQLVITWKPQSND
jgi:tetratricopeptide (TPR) repeat protein